MIVLSAGMQKAGSAWFFNLTNDLLIAAGHQDIRRLRKQFHLQRILTEVNCNLGTLRAAKLAWVSLPHFLGKTYAVKTHEPPTPAAEWMIDRGMMKATYIHRDPRDVAVSLFRHGERIRASQVASDAGFDRLATMEAAISFAQRLIDTWDAWEGSGRALLFSYEKLRSDPVGQAGKLVEYLGLDLQDRAIRSVVDRYRMGASGEAPLEKGLHFDKGQSGRWKIEMTQEQRELCDRWFGERIERKGYPRDPCCDGPL